MSYSTSAGRRRKHHIYGEFASYYSQERCPWAPASPRRLFKLAFKKFFRAYRRHLTPEQFLAVVYDTLGTRRGRPRGLFQTFDPRLYKNSLPLEEHFVNLFATKLKGRLKNHVKRAASAGRLCDPTRLRFRGQLELVGKAQSSPRERDLLGALPEAMDQLDDEEHTIITLAFWHDLSLREIGAILRRDHKTVGRRQEAALRKLRRFYDVDSAAA
jgi:RNA polymerase sigma factor (sigma-70 family)